jgi:hypothetical protein
MSKVNLKINADTNERLFKLQNQMIAQDNLEFFQKLVALIEEYEPKEEVVNNTSKTIRSLTDAFVAVAKEKNFPLYYSNEFGVDTDIFDWLPQATVAEGEAPNGAITMLRKNTAERNMTPNALKLPLSQAIERMTDELRNGYFDRQLKWLIIYLSDTKGGVPLELVCYRDGGRLRLNVYEVSPVDVWGVDDGYGVGFLSNES